MHNFVIVTDSCCDLSAALAEEMDLAVIHLNVLVEDQTYTNYLDWREITAGAFYDLMRDEKTASTSAPSIGDFAAVLELFCSRVRMCSTWAFPLPFPVRYPPACWPRRS